MPSISRPVVRATADIDPANLSRGETVHVFQGGQSVAYGVTINPFGVMIDDNDVPYLDLMAGPDAKVESTPPILSVYVGDTITIDGVGTVTLVSMDESHGQQAYTFLIIRDRA